MLIAKDGKELQKKETKKDFVLFFKFSNADYSPTLQIDFFASWGSKLFYLSLAMSKQKIQDRLTVNSTHINANFEGYKLQPFPDSESVIRQALSSGHLDVAREGQQHNNRLGFRELQARVRFNHLAFGCPLNNDVGLAYFVEKDYSVHAVTFDKV